MRNSPKAEPTVIVVGSGAAGLVAALRARQSGASVLLIEKSGELGGTSATSGGGIWIPCSPLAAGVEGHADNPAEAFQYIRALAAGWSDDNLIHAYVEAAPRMLEWLHASTEIRYAPLPYPDYHLEVAGAKTGYRTHMPAPVDARKRGYTIRNLRRASPAASLGGILNWTFEETYALLYRPAGWPATLARMIWRFLSDLPFRLTSLKDRYWTLGNALVGSLVVAAREAGVELRTHMPLKDLVVRDGRVTGLVVEGPEGKQTLAADAVILTSGGFERNRTLRAQHMPQVADPRLSGSQINNTGDSLLAAQEVGAATRGLGAAWWAPVFRVEGEDRARLCTIERALPGCIMVDQRGQRFMNEAMSYHRAGEAMMDHAARLEGEARFWMIFDARFRRLYPMGALYPLIPLALHPAGVRRTVRRASNLAGLATKTGLPAAALMATVERFNQAAEAGQDVDFGRGESAYDKMYGDARVSPNPTLGALARGPFYAVPIHAGDIGTCGGLATNEVGQVLDDAGAPIGGLYAAGNLAASVMGGSYPGAGSTLGPGMTFAWLAGRHAAGAAG